VAPAPPVVAQAAEPAAAPSSAAATPVAVAEGRVRLAITPWGEVYVDGKNAGVSPPLTEIRLPAGKHSIEIRNGSFAPHRKDIEISAAATQRIKHKFE
jgi:serine/threonine-protein kinase